MKLIRNKQTGLIEFAFDNDSTTFVQTSNSIIVDGKEFTNLDPNDYEEETVVGQNVPAFFVPNAYNYYNGWEESTVLMVVWDRVRTERNKRLTESDWTQMPDVTLINKPAWDTYRQALRDLPSNTINPFVVEWPEKP